MPGCGSFAAIGSSMIMMCRRFVALDDDGGNRRRGNPTRGGQAAAVDDEDLVGHRLQPIEPLEEVLMVKPVDADLVAPHQPSTMYRDGSCADSNERYPSRRCELEETHRVGM